MEERLKTIMNNLQKNKTWTVDNQNFLNKGFCDEYLKSSRSGTLIFFQVDFKRVGFTCDTFKNCT